MRNVLSALAAYVVFGIAIAVGLPAIAVIALLTFPFDRNHLLAGRALRLCARLGSSGYPGWRMELRDVPRPPRNRPFVVVANHESILDVFLVSRLPWEMKWMAKASLFRLPWIGQMLWLGGDIPVDRRNRRSGARALERARRYLQRGMPVMLFPEGTRSRDGRLLPFKPGAFRLAIETGAPILPVALHGSAGGMPVHSPWIRPTWAIARVLPPEPVAGLTEADLPALIERVRERIAAARQELARNRAEALSRAEELLDW